jgi:quercetin dioxygenase-like cupin family protein
MQYQCRPVGAKQWPDPMTVAPGESVFTPPMVEHRVSFPIDTVLVSCSKLGREHDAHEADVVRVKP